MRKLRRFQFAEIAGLVIALLFLVGGMIALIDPHELVLFRASNDFVGTPSGIIEGLSPDATRYYAIGALVVGTTILLLVLWPARRDDA
jgi:hypothetical protein